MLVQAAEHLESGAMNTGYDLVLVDEFQDASQTRARLTKALIGKPGATCLPWATTRKPSTGSPAPTCQ